MRLIESLLPAHFTRLNRIIFFLSILFSVLAFVALLKIAPHDEEQSRTLLATLVDQEQYVTRKFSNSLSFNEISTGQKLFNGDQIFTGENSKAKIVFTKSKNVLNIPARGLVKIEEGKSGENVEIQKGLAEFVIQKGQTLNIVKGNETLNLTSNGNESSSGTLSYNDDKLVLQVASGQVSLSDAAGKSQNIKKDESISVGDKDVIKEVKASLITPTWDKKVDIWKGINLSWKNPGPIEATLSKSSNFNSDVVKVKAESSPFLWELPLEVGKYYLKVKAIAPNAKDEPVVSLEMYSPHSINDFTPANETAVDLKRGEGLRLAWNEVPAEKYRVTLHNAEGAPTTYVTSRPEITLQNVKGNSLEWSVAPLLHSGIYLADSAKNKVTLTYNGENKIITPKLNQTFMYGKDKIILSWSSLPEESVHFKVTDSKQQIILEKTVQATQMEFVPPRPGKYTLTLNSLDYANIAPAVVNFMASGKIAEWVSRESLQFESVDEESKTVELKFEPLTKNLGELELAIYDDAGLKNQLRAGRVLAKTISYPLKNFGTYCLVIRPFDRTSGWMASDSKCIIYKQRAAFDKVPDPKNIVVKYVKLNDVGSYSIEVPLVPRADTYELQVFRDAKAKSMVYTDRSKSNIMKWSTRKTGIYYYRYRTFDSKQRNSDYSNMAKLVFPISPLTEWQE